MENPKNVSQLELKHNSKYWVKPDEIYLHDKKETQPPSDPFKKTYSAKAKNTDERQNWAKPISHPPPNEDLMKR